MSVAADIGSRFRRAIQAVGLGVAPTAATAAASVPTITSGAGVPNHTAANGSIYLRTDGAAATTIYVRAAGAWTANA